MVLCEFCENINIEEVAAKTPPNFKNYGGQYDEPPGYSHQPSWPSLVESAKSCELCSLIKDIGESKGILPSFDPKFDAIPDQIARRNASQRLKVRGFRPGNATSHSGGPGFSSLSISSAQRLYILTDIVAREGSAAALSGDVVGRPIDGSISDRTFQLISSWMDSCFKTHTICSFLPNSGPTMHPVDAETIMPTRILSIGSSPSDPVHLFVTHGARGKYAALSHRWGKRESMPLTTTANLVSRTKEIPPEDLTQLFLDAVEVTRRLRIRYLWIDSLCIVQDSREDWNRESVTMGDVFGRSQVTISAAVSEDGSSGFLGLRDTSIVQGSYRTHRDGPVEGDLFFRRTKNLLETTVRNCPLNQRAWVLQERILAPRVLTFTPTQLFWECREMLEGEGGPQAGSLQSSDRRLLSILRSLSMDEQNVTLKTEMYFMWRQIVALASEAELTYETDRLPAILGLARHISRVTKSEYRYGTWIDDLPIELCWEVQPRNKNMFTCKRPARHRAPSWSWASMEGPVTFGSELNGCTVCFERVDAVRPSLLSPTSPRDDALNLSAHVRTCEVNIAGLLWGSDPDPTIIPREDEFWVRATKGGGFAMLSETGHVVGGARFDLQPTEESMGKYSVVLLLESVTNYGPNPTRYGIALFLSASNQTDTFVRVGRVSVSPRGIDWFKSVGRQNITLI